MQKQDHNQLRILIAGGGTGGHLFPAIAIAKGLRTKVPGCEIRFVGSYYGMESKLLPEANEVFYPLDIRGIRRGYSWSAIKQNFAFPSKFLRAYRRSRAIIKLFRPDVVVGTGGYASGIPLMVAQRKKIPTLIQEQNSYAGLTTRKLAKKADMVCLTYEEALANLEAKNHIISGNPLSYDEPPPTTKEARKNLKLPSDKKILLVLGGSQGSRALNTYFKGQWRHYIKKLGIYILWQTGYNEYDGVAKAVGKGRGVKLMSFINDMPSAYMAADLVVCRSGAMTLSELTAFGRPALLIPFPDAAADHQTKNAQMLRRKKAARLITESALKEGVLEEAITDLIHDDKRLEQMAKRAKKLAKPDATTKIVKEILKLANY